MTSSSPEFDEPTYQDILNTIKDRMLGGLADYKVMTREGRLIHDGPFTSNLRAMQRTSVRCNSGVFDPDLAFLGQTGLDPANTGAAQIYSTYNNHTNTSPTLCRYTYSSQVIRERYVWQG